jgi:MATE family multidrug resistance protein
MGTQRELGLWQELRTLVVLASPVVLGQVGSMAMGVVDVAMVGRLGTLPLAAMALAHTWGFSSMILARGATHGLDPLVAQAHGAGDKAGASKALVRGVVLALLMAVPVTGMHFLASPGLGLLQQPQELLAPAGAYCAVLGIAVLPMLLFLTLRQFLQGLEYMRPATEAVIVANVANVLLNHGLMTGAWGLPELGAVGCAWSSVICTFLMLAWLMWRVRPLLAVYRIPLAGVVTWTSMMTLLGLGLPVGLSISVEVWAFNMTNVMMGWLGPRQLAGHTVAMTLATISFMVPLGISAAAATRVGNLLGAGKRWQRSGWLAVGLGVVVMGFSAILFRLVPSQLAGLFTHETEIVVVAAALIPLAGLFQLFDGFQVVSFGVLRGAGDVRFPMLVPVIAYWGVGLPMAYWAAFHLGLGPQGVWWGLICALAVAAVLLAWRIRVTGKRGGTLVGRPAKP